MKTDAQIRELTLPLNTSSPDYVWAKIYVSDVLFNDSENKSGHMLCRLEGLSWCVGERLTITIERATNAY